MDPSIMFFLLYNNCSIDVKKKTQDYIKMDIFSAIKQSNLLKTYGIIIV